jgi:uncharacterized membrane protein YhaH (DUF805 family)
LLNSFKLSLKSNTTFYPQAGLQAQLARENNLLTWKVLVIFYLAAVTLHFFKHPVFGMNYYLTVLKKYVIFTGRARRAEYWQFALVNTIISGLLFFAGTAINSEVPRALYSVAVLVPSLAVAVRRMHDVDKSGWFILIPIYNFILAIKEGTHGPNEYGPDPKDPDGLFDQPANVY